MRPGLSVLLAISLGPAALCGQSDTALRGAGATFPAPIYQKWIASFQASAPGLPISYEAVGSEEGIQRLRRGEVDFAASDILPDKNIQDQLGIETFPSVVGAVVPAYNIQGLARDLRFTPDLLAGIFLGRITKWNDPRIKEVNRGVNLPAADIVVVHRLDGSGTTYVFSSYLSKTNLAWREAIGAGSTLHWPVGQGAKGNEGVADALIRTPYSIGYLEFIYALQNELSYGAVKNAAGKFVRPDIDSIAAAARSAAPVEHFRIDVDDAPGRDAYPIASFTWLLVSSQMQAGVKRERLGAFLDWAFSSGQREAGALGYVAVPEELAGQERSAVARFRSPQRSAN
jgi:phosphate ABC transporter phosphate-binding protein